VIGHVNLWTRKAALEAARRMLLKIQAEGHDPQKAKRDAAEAAKKMFEIVVAEFIERKRKEGTRSGTLRAYERYLKGYYFEPFHKRPFDEIGGPEFDARIKFIENEVAKGSNSKGGNETAYACHAAVKYLYEWAAETGRFPEDRRNPLSKVEAPVKNRSGDRVLTPDEIRIIWKACDDWEAETQAFEEKGISRAPGGFTLLTDYPRALKLLFHTGMRAKEMGDLHWTEVRLPDPNNKDDVGEIYLRAYRTKEKRAKCIPLSDTAVEILRKIERHPGDPCVFGRGDGRPIVLDGHPWKEGLYLGDTVGKIMKRLRRGDIGFWKHEVDPEKKRRILYALTVRGVSINQIMREEQVAYRTIKAIEAKQKGGPDIETQPAPAMAPWRMHDIRRTFRTGLGECGVHDSIGERLLGHLDPYSNKTQETYARYAKWREKIHAVREWEAQLKRILDGTEQEIPRSKSDREAA
jgi:integrase